MGAVVGIMFSLIICIAVGWYATTLRRSFIGWVFASLIFTPVLTAIILMLLGINAEKPTL